MEARAAQQRHVAMLHAEALWVGRAWDNRMCTPTANNPGGATHTNGSRTCVLTHRCSQRGHASWTKTGCCTCRSSPRCSTGWCCTRAGTAAGRRGGETPWCKGVMASKSEAVDIHSSRAGSFVMGLCGAQHGSTLATSSPCPTMPPRYDSPPRRAPRTGRWCQTGRRR